MKKNFTKWTLCSALCFGMIFTTLAIEVNSANIPAPTQAGLSGSYKGGTVAPARNLLANCNGTYIATANNGGQCIAEVKPSGSPKTTLEAYNSVAAACTAKGMKINDAVTKDLLMNSRDKLTQTTDNTYVYWAEPNTTSYPGYTIPQYIRIAGTTQSGNTITYSFQTTPLSYLRNNIPTPYDIDKAKLTTPNRTITTAELPAICTKPYTPITVAPTTRPLIRPSRSTATVAPLPKSSAPRNIRVIKVK